MTREPGTSSGKRCVRTTSAARSAVVTRSLGSCWLGFAMMSPWPSFRNFGGELLRDHFADDPFELLQEGTHARWHGTGITRASRLPPGTIGGEIWCASVELPILC